MSASQGSAAERSAPPGWPVQPVTARQAHTRIHDELQREFEARLNPSDLREPPVLTEYGVPAPIATAFARTVAEIDAVLLTRLPGAAATQLILDRHDLKSFFVHAKSCNWGPMAGFICQLPALNKNGPGGMRFNLLEHVATESKFRRLGCDPTQQFIGLTLSEAAWGRLQPGYVPAEHTTADTGGNRVLGVAASKNGQVVLEWVRERVAAPDPAGFANAIYHRQVWVRGPDGRYAPYLGYDPAGGRLVLHQPGAETLPVAAGDADRLELSEQEAQQLTALRGQWAAQQEVTLDAGLSPGWAPERVFRLRVAQNPYPPYRLGDPRNAVTGDYDLFALWPRRPAALWAGALRFSEWDQQHQRPAPSARLRQIFHPVPQRRFTLALTAAPQVYVEVIPGWPEIERLEDDRLGNMNDAVYHAAGMLNSFARSFYGETGGAPNAAFHSDEGGRPLVTEIDYPVAAFLPLALAGPGNPQTLVITDHAEFLSLIERLVGRCEIPLNHGWLIHLIADLADADQRAPLAVTAESDAAPHYIRKRGEDHDLLARGNELEPLRRRVATLLTGGLADWGSHPVQQTVRAVLEVARMQLQNQTPPAVEMVDQLLDIPLSPPEVPQASGASEDEREAAERATDELTP